MKLSPRFRWGPILMAGLVAVIVIGVSFGAQVLLWRYAKVSISQHILAGLDQESFLVGARVRGRANDMFFLKRVVEQELARDPRAPLDGGNLRSAITSMLLARGQYANIKILNLAGHETLRYNLKGDSVIQVPPEQLQDKSMRPYYRQTLAAPSGAVVFSPIDLNIEFGQIEMPIVPTLRASGLIVGPDGKPRAMLVLNYIGELLFRDFATGKDAPAPIMVLNPDGYWLVGPTPESEWGFMYPERKGTNLRDEDPKLWRRLHGAKAGYFDQGGKLYCYEHVDPVGSPSDYPPLRMAVKGAGQLQLTLVSVLPNAAVWNSVHAIDLGLWIACAAAVLTVSPLTWFGIVSIQRRRAAMAEMRELTRQAQAAERAKSEFLAIMSHEIRTPMNGVIGMTGLLEDTELTDVQRDYLHTIHTSGEVLLTVINDILDFSKIESGKMNLEQIEFDLRVCIEEAIDLFAVRVREKKLELTYLIAAEAPTRVVGDPNHLRQILTNLIGNAVKFTGRGEIHLRVERPAGEEAGSKLLFSVTDTGIGIAENEIARLFQPFYQVGLATTRRYGGTGLGLVISRRLAEMMGGAMWAESRAGLGSTFRFTAVLPAAPVQGSVGSTEERPLPTPCSLLIVDDNETNRRILEEQARGWGMSAVAVASGEEALRQLEREEADVVLVDLIMPGLDGIALAREIRRKWQMPLILLSSTGNLETGETARLFAAQLPKPIKQSVLLETLRKLTGVSTRGAERTITRRFDEQLAERHPLRILLAEDNLINQKVVLRMLARMGYGADVAMNGQEALTMAGEHSYDLVLMDVQMPVMGGVEASERLREKLRENCPFLVAVTAEALHGDRERFLGLGFDGYLSKPLRPEELRGMLETVHAAV